jgi:heptosyltransferase I
MKKILLVKTSSLGDVIHNLPVVSDIRAAVPDARIDWAVEESLVTIPALHPAVDRVLPVALRRWRSSFLNPATRAEIRAFLGELQRETYDAVIDTQGLLKSALVTWMARGTRHGLDLASAREPLFLFYDRTYSVPWTLHAVERNRRLAAQALGYAVPGAVGYGIRAPAPNLPWLPREAYAVLVHATSAQEKLWPEARWIELGARLRERGACSVLTWGSAPEQRRAERIAQRIPGAVVTPALSLADAAALLGGARLAVGVDTGFTHFAAALDVATIGLYCATDPAATGLYGWERAVNLGGIGRVPEVSEVVAALDGLRGASLVTRHSSPAH